MRTAVVATLLVSTGILFGVGGTLIVSFWPPFGDSSPQVHAPIQVTAADGTISETFYIEAPQDALAATHNGQKPLDTFPQGIGLLDDKSIDAGFILLTKLRDRDGNLVGFASEQEVVSADTNILQGIMKMDVSWTLTIPGRGTIFLAQKEDGAQFVKRAVIPAIVLGKDFEAQGEPWELVTTVGPNADGTGVIVGGTGEFEGIRGRFQEVSFMERFTRNKEITGRFELRLSYRMPKATARG